MVTHSKKRKRKGSQLFKPSVTAFSNRYLQDDGVHFDQELKDKCFATFTKVIKAELRAVQTEQAPEDSKESAGEPSHSGEDSLHNTSQEPGLSTWNYKRMKGKS